MSDDEKYQNFPWNDTDIPGYEDWYMVKISNSGKRIIKQGHLNLEISLDNGKMDFTGCSTQSVELVEEVESWLDDNCSGLWEAVNIAHIAFEKKDDALNFKLTWC